MRTIMKAGFLWQFLGGFALGTVGVVTLHHGAVAQTISRHFEAQTSAAR
jgi:hypothetical protein